MSSSIASFFSSFVSTTSHADSAEDVPAETEAAPVEEAEEEEPEDVHPILREECKATAQCAALTKHFEHCQEKVQAGEGFKGEDCVEELMMHCVDQCAGPKLFTKLR